MSITKPTPGELYDRLAIVRLKINFCEEKKETKLQMQFENELLEIMEYLHKKFSAVDLGDIGLILSNATLCSQLDKFLRLEEIHKKLWGLESERRRLMRDHSLVVDDFGHYAAIGRNAEKTTLLNDERQRLIVEINTGFGVNGIEKLYHLESKT